MSKRILLIIVLVMTMLVLSACGGTEPPPTEEPAAEEPAREPAEETTPIPDAYQLAIAGVTSNYDWIPYIEEINGIEMVLVPAGCFMMGSTENQIDDALTACNDEIGNCAREWFENEGPAHEVCFAKPFWIDLTEVTNGYYGSSGRFSGVDRPRETIDWFDASDFCENRGGRLPTEAEWEYAARGTDALIYPWGNSWNNVNAVFGADSTADVGSKPVGASWVGALDMSGNVWEWVADWYDKDYYSLSPELNPTGPSSGNRRVLRGGSWGINVDSHYLRSANRGGANPALTDHGGGFRCVLPFTNS